MAGGKLGQLFASVIVLERSPEVALKSAASSALLLENEPRRCLRELVGPTARLHPSSLDSFLLAQLTVYASGLWELG